MKRHWSCVPRRLWIQLRGEFRQHDCLVAIGTRGDHADLRAALALLESEILPGSLGQLVKLGNALGGFAPALERGVDAA